MPQRWIPTSRRDPGYMIDGRHELGSPHHEGSHSHQARDHHPQTAGGVSHHYYPGMSTHPRTGHGYGAGGGPHHGTVVHVSPHHDPHPIREGEMSMFQHRVVPDRPHPAVVHQYHDIPARSLPPPPPPPPPPPHEHHHSLGPASHPHGNNTHHPFHDVSIGHPHHSSPQHEQKSHPAIHHAHALHHDTPLDPHPRIHSQHPHNPTPHSSSRNPIHHAGAHGHSMAEHEGGAASHLHHPTYLHPTGHHLDYHPSPHHHPDHHHLIPPHHHQGPHPHHINRHDPAFHASHATLHPDMAYAPLDLSLYRHGYTSHHPHHHVHPWMSEGDAYYTSRMGLRHFYHPHHRYDVYPIDPMEEIHHHHVHSHRHHFHKEGDHFEEMLTGSYAPFQGDIHWSHAHAASHHPQPGYYHHHHDHHRGLHRHGAIHGHHHEPHHHDSHADHVHHDSPDGAAASRHHHHDHITARHHHQHHQHHVHFPEVDEHHCGDVSFGTDPTKYHVAIPLKPGFKPDDVVINVQLIDEKDLHVEFRHDHHDPRVQTSRILRHVLTLPHHVAVDSLKSTLNPHGVLVIEGLIKTSANTTTCHNIEVEIIEPQAECADDEKHVICKEQKDSVEESE